MRPVKMIKNKDLSGYRILMIAIAISFVWHIFWLSAVKIVSSPMPKEPVKFSKVSFLGQILARVSMEVRASPAARSLLERRYRKIAGSTFYKEDGFTEDPASKYEGRGLPGPADETFSSAVDDAVAGEKLEPDYLSE